MAEPVSDRRLEVDFYYELLEATQTSTVEDISKSYRRLSLRAQSPGVESGTSKLTRHPDKPGGSQAKFQELARAHEVLTDEKK